MTRPSVTIYNRDPERAAAKLAKKSAPAPNGCTVWTGAKIRGGYGRFVIGGRGMYVHRAALELKLGRPIGTGLEAMHSCDNPTCIDPTHLREGSHHDNMQDRERRGRGKGAENLKAAREVLRIHPELRVGGPKGEASGNAKLTEADVRAIRIRSAAGESLRHLAAEFGLASHTTIRSVVLRKTWQHVDP